jgi:hypothetical protein
MVQDVCYNNAARYFGFKLEAVSTVHKQEGQDE